ncbi:MAG: menaquinone biosynthesis protein [Planctomycetaceae bacterium]
MTDQFCTSQATMAPQIELPPGETGTPARDSDSRPGSVMLRRNADSVMKTIRIGAVSYLNSKPLVEDLSRLLPQAEVSLDYPSHLADALAAGRIDVGLVPSIEAFRDPDYQILSDACVATHGPVHSVKLYSRVHPGFIRSLALDEGSRTSAALARIMLHERYGVVPELRPLPLGRSVEHSETDAVVVIGDRAMRPVGQPFETVWDLGEEWADWTGLPFVFAMWAGRGSSECGRDVIAGLARSRDLGVSRFDQIAGREAARLGISTAMAAAYLRENLHFRLGAAERSGLRLFQELAARLGLAPEGVSLTFRV